MEAFIRSLHSGGAGALTTARQSLASHLMACAAEQARLDGQVIRFDLAELPGGTNDATPDHSL